MGLFADCALQLGRIGAPLTIATPDGAGQPVHPSVRYVAGGWNGWAYWMACSGGYATTVENPCVYHSQDGVNWTAATTNPIATATDPNYWSDPELVFSADGTTLYCVSRYGDGTLWAQSSTNGTTWTSPAQMTCSVGATYNNCSPSIEWDGEQFVMWTQGNTITVFTTSNTGGVIQRRTASAIAGPWSDPEDCTAVFPLAGRSWWHQTVRKVGSEWHMLAGGRLTAAATPSQISTVFASSADGLTWDVAATAVAAYQTTTWDGEWYRATFAVMTVAGEQVYRIWPSCITNGYASGIGYTEFYATQENAHSMTPNYHTPEWWGAGSGHGCGFYYPTKYGSSWAVGGFRYLT